MVSAAASVQICEGTERVSLSYVSTYDPRVFPVDKDGNYERMHE